MSRYGAERWPDDIEIERPEWVERFHALMRSPDAKAKHEAYLKELGVREEEVLPPAIPGTDCFNPVLEKFWLPFARSILFAGYPRVEYLDMPGNMAVTFLGKRVQALISWSTPTLSVLRYMVDSAPGGRILDVGAGTGYWSALLAGLGADVVAIDNFCMWSDRPEHAERWGDVTAERKASSGAETSSGAESVERSGNVTAERKASSGTESVERSGNVTAERKASSGAEGSGGTEAPSGAEESGGQGGAGGKSAEQNEAERSESNFQARPFYFDVQNEDAAEYIRAGKAQDRALFFSWPAGVMHCIEHYTGDTIFWVGEDATEELKLYASFRDLWIEVHRMKMPRWLTVHDEFVVYKRKASMS